MRENIDILSFLEGVVLRNTHSYREDFQFDVRKLTRAAQAQDAVDRSFYWMSRPCGTWCLNERAVLIRDSFEHSAWTIYESEAEKVKAFRVTVTGQDQGRPIGNVYPIDYKSQVRRVLKNAVRAENVSLTFLSGQTITFPCDEVEGRQRNITAQYGSIEKVHYIVQDEHELERLILFERQQPGPKPKRPKAPPQRASR